MIEPKGLDTKGFIRTISCRPIQPVFQAVVDKLCEMLRDCLGSLIDSVYLYGSVARGDAMAGRSDLDVTLILIREPTLQDNQAIESVRISLEGRHSEVTKVDFDVGCLADVHSPENLCKWGFWLKHHCRCVYGNDLANQFALFQPSRLIARAVNGDFPDVLATYAQRIEAEKNVLLIESLKRAASRKLIRSTNVLRPVEALSWPESLEDHVDHFLMTYPEMRPQITSFLCQQQMVDSDQGDFVERLRIFSAWMQLQI
ncbi:Nucleotidyltransferase domain-containing protein [Collimonas sp. OK307]|uniref:nucleotidyltransferase domain-containing protein n=1 Tax=Collimonas sp. OK307 TaxID=1801620 RepID=UPI0008E9545B|nr:nucleotidyltransferase domain-containing protein [Collimonas sp. OK307]SFI16997.1 Nucleotidyltransferase domain-containing protein [Collimonas sp. OK307]